MQKGNASKVLRIANIPAVLERGTREGGIDFVKTSRTSVKQKSKVHWLHKQRLNQGPLLRPSSFHQSQLIRLHGTRPRCVRHHAWGGFLDEVEDPTSRERHQEP